MIFLPLLLFFDKFFQPWHLLVSIFMKTGSLMYLPYTDLAEL